MCSELRDTCTIALTCHNIHNLHFTTAPCKWPPSGPWDEMCCTVHYSGSRGTSRRRGSGRRCLFPDTPGRPGTSRRPRTRPVVLSTSVKPLQFARSSNVPRLARVARTVQCHPHPHSAAPQQATNTREELRPACSLLSNRSSSKQIQSCTTMGYLQARRASHQAQCALRLARRRVYSSTRAAVAVRHSVPHHCTERVNIKAKL
jgi:hypothetical protein